jgi:hypothetical protein
MTYAKQHRFATFYNSRIRNIISHTSPTGVRCITAIVCENERYGNGSGSRVICDGEWSSDYLTRTDWPALSDVNGLCAIQNLQSVELLAGYKWLDEWHVDIRPHCTDADGCYYASCFDDLSAMWWDGEDMRTARVEITGGEGMTRRSVRSKCWHRHMVRGFHLEYNDASPIDSMASTIILKYPDFMQS